MRRTKSEAMETRAALLDAAETVFFEKGVSQTTLTDIARAAGVTRGAIYWHFADKAALFDAMQERGRLPQDLFSAGRRAACDKAPLEQLRQVGLEALRHLGSNERSRRVCTIMLLRCEFVGEMSGVLTRMRDADARMKAFIRAVFEEAAAAGALAENWTPESATTTFCCAMTGLTTEWLRMDGSFDLVKTGGSLMDALFSNFAHRQDLPAGRRASSTAGVASHG